MIFEETGGQMGIGLFRLPSFKKGEKGSHRGREHLDEPSYDSQISVRREKLDHGSFLRFRLSGISWMDLLLKGLLVLIWRYDSVHLPDTTSITA